VNRLLVDTSAYSGLLRADPRFVGPLRDVDEIVVSPVVLGELLAGFRGGSRRRQNEDALQRFLSSPRASVTTIDTETSERYAVILDSLRRAGTPIPTNDIWIAATAMQLGAAVLTGDEHFRRVPQVLVLGLE
jgi:tRNA(fMet)-specific endonuclease VapC